MSAISELGRRLRQSKPVAGVRARIPRRAKHAVRAVCLSVGLRWVSWSFARDRIPSRLALGVTRVGWGNSGWPADAEFVRASCALIRRSTSDVLECGSGLSTAIFGLALRGTGKRLVSLEHTEEWFGRVDDLLARLDLDRTTVEVVSAPLTDYGEFDWYSVPPSVEDHRFGVVICDGPPRTTRGGRYGLLPVVGDSLEYPTTILLDDSHREGEKLVLRQWADRFGAVWEDHETNGFAMVTTTVGVPPPL